MKISGFLLTLIISVALFSSCNTQQKTFGYVENYADTTKRSEIKYTEPLIQKNDLLSIFIYSASLDQTTDVIYNLPNLGASSAGGATTQGFLVDNNGNIEYPRVGIIKAEGLTKAELGEIIKTKINQPEKVLENPTVIIRLLNFKVTMLGEVAKAGPISVPGERLNILEAIGLAGDITIYGKRKEVIVMRPNNGEMEYGKIDLSSKDLFRSPYFQLLQNDIVLVNAGKNKSRLNEQLFAQRISLGLSVISAIALLYNIFR